ncbi:MAG TPA: DinB family protein [Alphaproteobacteria bacterium]|nr:DinB family protein [Alphaproteobacteria bacterium]
MEMDADRLAAQVNESRRRADQLASGLSRELFMRRPEPDQWSIAECITHLNITGNVVQGFMKQAVARARKNNILGKPPFKLGPRGRILIWVAEPPPKFRMSAPRRVVPPVTIPDPSQVMPDFMSVQDGWERLVKDADGLDLARISMGPLFSPFRCRLSGGLMWMMAHQQRHLLQAEKVKMQLQGNPGAA